MLLVDHVIYTTHRNSVTQLTQLTSWPAQQLTSWPVDQRSVFSCINLSTITASDRSCSHSRHVLHHVLVVVLVVVVVVVMMICADLARFRKLRKPTVQPAWSNTLRQSIKSWCDENWRVVQNKLETRKGGYCDALQLEGSPTSRQSFWALRGP